MRFLTAITAIALAPGLCNAQSPGTGALPLNDFSTDSLDRQDREYFIADGDTIFWAFIPIVDIPHTGPLTAADFREVAGQLGVEAAAIRAVVEVETGNTRSGFHSDGRPLVNFDLAVFRRAARRRGIDVARAAREHPEVFSPPDDARYGNRQAAQHARLAAAMRIDSIAAMESTFWGMFQIGGFNWRLAGADSRSDFIDKVSRSEYDQLLLFANFIRNTGLLPYLKNKNWSAFARLYNGPAYAARRYHTRMAQAYRRFKAEEEQGE